MESEEEDTAAGWENWRGFPLVAERRARLIRVWKSPVVAGKERLANSLAIKETPLKSLVRSFNDAMEVKLWRFSQIA